MGIVLKSGSSSPRCARPGGSCTRCSTRSRRRVSPASPPGARRHRRARAGTRQGAGRRSSASRPGGAPPYPGRAVHVGATTSWSTASPADARSWRGRHHRASTSPATRTATAPTPRAPSPSGVISAPARRLLDVTRQALERAIARCVPGHRLRRHRRRHPGRTPADNGYSVVRELRRPRHRPGHARGAVGPQLRAPRARPAPAGPAWCIAIEPMLNQSAAPDVRVEGDGWTVVTDDAQPVRPRRAQRRHHRATAPAVLTAA